MEKHKTLTEWLNFFVNEFLPSITQEQSDYIHDILTWDNEKRAGFMLAKRVFEEKDV